MTNIHEILKKKETLAKPRQNFNSHAPRGARQNRTVIKTAPVNRPMLGVLCSFEFPVVARLKCGDFLLEKIGAVFAALRALMLTFLGRRGENNRNDTSKIDFQIFIRRNLGNGYFYYNIYKLLYLLIR